MTARAILLTGGSGFIGGHLVRALLARGDAVWVWSRNVERARRRLPAGVAVVGALADIPASQPIAAIVNLAGAPVVGPPWTRARRRVLIDSRVNPTRDVLAWCAARAGRPEALVSASAIGFYGTGGERWLDEDAPPTDEFQSQLCREREAAADLAQLQGIRAVHVRFGLVLGPDGGIFKPLALAARIGCAAVLGDGRQWMSWIHIADAVRIVEHALEDSTLRGPLNAVAPAPVRQRDFQRALTRALRRPLWLRIPAGALRAGLGEMSDLLVRSQRVAPRRLQAAGFAFRHPEFDGTPDCALCDLVRRGRS